MNAQICRLRTKLVVLTLVFATMIVADWVAAPRIGHAQGPNLSFDVLRQGEPIGHHTVTFRHVGDDLHVDIAITLEVKVAFITVFRYEHANTEIWRNGTLVAIETTTNDNGERHWLRGQASDDGLLVESSSGSYVAPVDVVPTSYWNVALVDRPQLLDTQSGRLITIDVTTADGESIVLAGETVETMRYDVTGDLDATLWYTASGEWAKFSFEGRGGEVVYRRRVGDVLG